ncbi:MAG: hypothetical protein R3234_08805 [Thermoanaerobaculia bacterium]|nr:hypothetical protein [Thermoanaerobaculia bacterium]
MDLLPTILDAVGVEIPPTARGESLLPRLRDEDSSRIEEARGDPLPVAVRINEEKFFRPWREIRGDRNVALRDGRFKGIVNLDPRVLELYDLEADPGELRNVADRHPEVARRMVSTARSWWEACRSRRDEHGPRQREEALPTGEIDELRALGYVQ